MNTLKKVAAKAIQQITSEEIIGWPPVCFGAIHQPERPVAKTDTLRDEKHQKSERQS